MSIEGAPPAIHSAAIRPIPPACVTHTASQIQNPRTSADSPTTEPISGVNENIPLNAVETSILPRTGGKSRMLSANATPKCAGVNGSMLGCGSPSRYGRRSSGSNRIGSCR